MMLLALAAAVATSPLVPEVRPGAAAPIVQATATVRIVSGARVSAAELPSEALVRETQVTGPDGVKRQARLVEFP
jgi:hypothetical protein